MRLLTLALDTTRNLRASAAYPTIQPFPLSAAACCLFHHPKMNDGRASTADSGRVVVPPRPDGGVALGAGGAGEKPDSEKSAYERLQAMLENDG